MPRAASARRTKTRADDGSPGCTDHVRARWPPSCSADTIMFANGPRRVVTIVTALRRPVCAERWLVTSVTDQLFQQATLVGYAVLAYCVMPDHLHALVEARSETSDFDVLMTRFKQATECAYRLQACGPLWQCGYYERILDDGEASDAAARYILENPVRAGLTTQVGDYPFAWSDVYDLESLIETPRTRRPASAAHPATRSTPEDKDGNVGEGFHRRIPRPMRSHPIRTRDFRRVRDVPLAVALVSLPSDARCCRSRALLPEPSLARV
jgi:REP-associated tyrosine transposase